MYRITLMSLASLLFVHPLMAQNVNPYNGSWSISFDGKKTVDLEGSVVVKDDGGSWNMVARSGKNPCVGRVYPIAIEKATADELTFTVNRAKTLSGCQDSTHTFKKVDDKTLTGEIGEGRAASLVRK
jgi:hypothetical protein